MARLFVLCLALALSLAVAKPDRFEDHGDRYWNGKRNAKILRSSTQRAVFYKRQKHIRLFSVGSGSTDLSAVKSLSPKAWDTLLRTDSDIAFARDVLFDSASDAEFIASDRLVAKARQVLAAEDARKLAGRAGLEFVEIKAGNILCFRLPDPAAEPLQAAARLSALPDIEWAQPEIYFKPRKFFLPDDPLFARQQHLRNVGQHGGLPGADVRIEQAWDITRGDPSIVIAILDDGVQTAHPDLRIHPGGRDFFADPPTGDPNPTTSKDDHGTSVAGVAAARGNNGLGVSGAAPNASILPIKITENDAFASNVAISDAIRYAADAGADIINNSWGGSPFDNLLNDAITYASTHGRGGKGCLVFCSSGNSSGLFNGVASKRGGPMSIAFSDTSTKPGEYSIGFRFSDAGSIPGDTDWVAVDNISVLSGDGYAVRFSESFGAGLPAGWTSSGTPWTVDSHYYSGTGDRNSMRSGVVGGAGALSELRMPLRTYAAGDVLRINWILNNAKGDFQVAFYDAGGAMLGLTASNDPGHSFGIFSGKADLSFPAGADDAIAVGSSTEFDFRSGYSQFNEAGTGKSVDFLAPSDGAWNGVTTTDRTGGDGRAASDYSSSFGGTSSASPLAAGVAALILSRNPNLTRNQVLAIMRATADKVGDRSYVAGWNTEYGYGRINAYQALLAVPLPPARTTLVSPPDGSARQPLNTVFTWNSVANATAYRLQLSMNPAFSDLIMDDSTLTDTSRQVNGMATGAMYYWRVSARNAGSDSPWSEVWSFATPNPTGMGPQWVKTAFPPGAAVGAFGLLGTRVYAGTANGIFQSPDEGGSWTSANGNLDGFIAQTFASAGDTIFIGTDRAGVLLSPDSGKGWWQIGWPETGLAQYNVLSLCKKGRTIFAGTGVGIFRSTDNGVSWNLAGAGTDSVFAITAKGSDVFAATGGGVFHSGDNGATWNSASAGLTDTHVNALGVSGGKLFAGTLRGRVFRSADNGATWTLVNEGWGSSALRSFAVMGKVLFAGTVSRGVYLSPDSGDSWIQVNRGLADTAVRSLIVNGAEVFAGTEQGGIFRYAGIPPQVSAGPDLRLGEGQSVSFTVTGSDPDDETVALSLLNPPTGSLFSPATGVFTWIPGFTQAGTYALRFRGASGSLVSAEDTVFVTVDNVDRPPRLDPIAGKSVKEGETLSITLSASDPDGDVVNYAMAGAPAGAVLSGPIFTWSPTYADSGGFRIAFIAQSLFLADTVRVDISVLEAGNGLGTLRLSSALEGTTLGVMPSGSYAGGPIGKDSAGFTGKPGIYFFSATKPGYRTSYVAGRVLLHQSSGMRIGLRRSIPLWFSAPESLRVDGNTFADGQGAVLAAADFDYDGRQDLMLGKGNELQFLRNQGSSDSAQGPYAVTGKIKLADAAGLASAAFVDWNNGGYYDVLASDRAGAIFVLHRNGSAFTDTLPLMSFPGDSVCAWAMDWDNDGKKDLWMHSQGKGMFAYRNTGTDANPGFASGPAEIRLADGTGLLSLASAPVWLDADNDGEKDMLAFQGGVLKIWYGKRSAGILELEPSMPLNVGGAEYRCGNCQLALQIGDQGLPRLLTVAEDGTIRVIHSHLLGDLDSDKVVDASDLGLLLDLWMKKPVDAGWVPRSNLLLNSDGVETIDDGDVGVLENSWEFRE